MNFLSINKIKTTNGRIKSINWIVGKLELSFISGKSKTDAIINADTTNFNLFETNPFIIILF